MRVQVVVKNMNKTGAASTTLDATVAPGDTVLGVQELIADTTKTFSFPDQKLLLKGQTLPSNKRLSECGVKEGDVLEFLFQASEQTVVRQLSELLGKQAMSPEELSLLYSYRYAASFDDTLKILGHVDAHIRSFLQNQKCFSFQGDLVKVATTTEKLLPVSAGLCPIKEDKVHGVIEVSVCVEVHVAGKAPELVSCDGDEDVYMRLEASETVARTKEILAASEQMPFPDCKLLLGDHELSDELSLAEAGVKNGSVLVMVVHASEIALAAQLEQLLLERVGLSPSELGLHYCQRFGTPVAQALRTLGLHGNLRRFLESQSQFAISGGCVTLVSPSKLGASLAQEDEYDSDHTCVSICEDAWEECDDTCIQ
jgi:uncharacterized ubiquitin-like protein YukD